METPVSNTVDTHDEHQATSSRHPLTIGQRKAINFSATEQQIFVRRANPVFDGVVYWINPAFSQSESTRLEKLLIEGGAQAATKRHVQGIGKQQKLNGVLVNALPQMTKHVARFQLPLAGGTGKADADKAQQVTHIISEDTHFAEYTACVEVGVCVVTAAWVERSMATGWQYVERFFSAASEDIFSGMVVVPTQMPVSDKETLLASVMTLGGQWREKMRADATHLILLRDEGAKYEYIKARPELGIKAILPHWFKDTLNLWSKMPLEPYVFPNPPMLQGRVSHESDGGDTQPTAVSVPSAGTHNGDAYELSKPTEAFLEGYGVAIDPQLRYSMSAGALGRLTQRLAEAGARVIGPGAEAAAAQADGEAGRELPESLVTDWEEVDILICQHREGYEYTKASRLGKLVGTLVWMYQAFLAQRLTAPTRRLLHYPQPATAVERMDRVRVTVSHYSGSARRYLARLVTAMGAEYAPRMTRATTHLVTARAEGRKYAAALEWNVDVVNHQWVEQSFQRWRLLAASHPMFTYFPQLPLLNGLVGATEVSVGRLGRWVEAPGSTMAEASDMDVLHDSELDESVAAPTVVRVDADASGGEGGSVEESPDEGAQEPGGTATTTAALGQTRQPSRAAAVAASRTLSEMMEATNLFETELRRERLHRYRRTTGGRRTLELADDVAPTSSKRPRTDGARGRKQATDAVVRILFTQMRPDAAEVAQIAALGGAVVEDAAHATHLICRSIKRTMKLLAALARGRVRVVSQKWLADSLARGTWIAGDETEQYSVVDADAEARWSFRLADSQRRGRARRLLEGVTVLVTPHVEPPLETLRALVELAGGVAVGSLPDARLQRLANTSARGAGGAERTPALLVVSCEADRGMWYMFQGMPIYAAEVILTGLLRQQIRYASSEFSISEGDV
ncbi:regulator of Ty1 Transposition [Coemansia sp. RSA 988]|nr:regulator of Ty1 Transposition [Coemansia sp. RSA 988]